MLAYLKRLLGYRDCGCNWFIAGDECSDRMDKKDIKLRDRGTE